MKFLANKKIVIFSALTTVIMAFIVMVIFDPLVDGKDGLDVIALQLSFSKEAGVGIVSGWNIEVFQKWILLDYLYALSYMLFFASIILWLEKEKGVVHSMYAYIAIFAGIFDWIENSLEVWFVHDIEGFSSVLFFVHSIVATLKWLALPLIMWCIVQLYRVKNV